LADKTANNGIRRSLLLLAVPKQNPPDGRLVNGADNTSEEFHNTLKKLLADPEPIAGANAALALVRLMIRAGVRADCNFATLHRVAPASGVLLSSLSSGAQISRGTLLGRIQPPNGEVVEMPFAVAGLK